MLLSQTAEYALRAVVWLAEQADSAQTTQQIADATKVPPGYLSKVLQTLGRHGIVRSQRGLYGGFALAKDPKTLTALDVINAVDPIIPITRCPLDKPEHRETLCPLHRELANAIGQLERAFCSATIAALVDTPAPSA